VLFRARIISGTIDRVVGRIDGILHINYHWSGGAEFRHNYPSKGNWALVYPSQGVADRVCPAAWL
jgi:hypothetical protein